MHTSGTILVFFAAVAASVAPLASQTRPAGPVTVSSPDGKDRAELNAADGVLRYRVLVDGKQVLAPSKIGIEADDVEFGQDVTLGSAKIRKVDEHYRFFGAHAEAIDRANEATIPAQSHGQSYMVDVHVANDGVGVRLRLPAKAGRRVQADRSTMDARGRPDGLGGQARQLVREPISPDDAQTARHGQHRLPAYRAGRTRVPYADRGAGEGLRRSGRKAWRERRAGRSALRRSQGMDHRQRGGAAVARHDRRPQPDRPGQHDAGREPESSRIC